MAVRSAETLVVTIAGRARESVAALESTVGHSADLGGVAARVGIANSAIVPQAVVTLASVGSAARGALSGSANAVLDNPGAVGVVALRAGLSANARWVGRADSTVGLSAAGSITGGVHTFVSALELVEASRLRALRSSATAAGSAVSDRASGRDSASRV